MNIGGSFIVVESDPVGIGEDWLFRRDAPRPGDGDRGACLELTMDERPRLQALERENQELQALNDFLREASSCFVAAKRNSRSMA
jgi:transposase